MFLAVNIRLGDIDRARQIAEAKEAEAEAEAETARQAKVEEDAVAAVQGAVLGKKGATIVTRTTMGVERRRKDL